MPWPEDAFDTKIDADVKKFGQSIIGTETEERVPMAYTVGLAEADLPELVCSYARANCRSTRRLVDSQSNFLSSKRSHLRQVLGTSIMRMLAPATR